MSGHLAPRDGGMLPPSVRYTASTDRLRTAIDNLDAAAKAERISPGSALGAWVAAQKDVLNALYVMEEGREEQLRMLIEGAKATAEAEAARAQAEVRRLGLSITKAEIELAQKQSETVEAIGKAIAAHVQGALVIRAKAYNTTKYLTTALVYAVVLLGTLLGGYAWSTGGTKPDLPSAASSDTAATPSGTTPGGTTTAQPAASTGTSTAATAATIDPGSTNPSGSTTQAPAGPSATVPAPSSASTGAGAGADTLVLALSEDAYQGDARFQLTVDGKAVGDARAVTASHGKGQAEAFTFKGDWSGAHRFGVTFTNDAWGGLAGVDRNLYVESATLDGTPVEGAAALHGNGTVTFGTGLAGGAVQGGTPVTANGPVSLALAPGALPSAPADAAATPVDVLTVTDNDGGTAAVPLVASGSRTDHSSGTSTIQQNAGGGTDTITTSGGVKGEGLALGGGTRKLVLVNPRAMVLTGGSGTDTVAADGGANQFAAGSGSLDVTGGPDADEFVLHAGAGSLTIEDFDAAKGDALLLDKSLQGSLKQAPDGHGGTVLSFGAGTGTVELIGRASLDLSGIRFV